MSVQIFKATALPETLVANGLYFLTAENGALMEVHMANSAGTGARKVLGEAEVSAAIASYDAGGASKLKEAFALALTGAVTGTVDIDGSGNVSLATTLADQSGAAGNHAIVTVNSKGLVTGGRALQAADLPAEITSNTSGNAATATLAAEASKVTNTISINGEVFDGSGAKVFNLVDASEKGESNGVATLDEFGKIPASQLPLTVDEVIEYETREEFPETGQKSKIYVAAEDNVMYRWTGTSYIVIPGGTALAETALKLQTTRTIGVSGDATGSALFDGSADATIAVTLKDVGTAGEHKAVVTTDAKGRVTGSRDLELADLPAGIQATGLELAAPAAW